tara:strand:- start:133 stop:765 length:633 start_codon:yes stop_codon:yes gene_type:complete
MSNSETKFKRPIRAVARGEKVTVGWVPATKEVEGKHYWLKANGELGKLHEEEFYNVYVGFGNTRRLVNYAGKLPEESIEPYDKYTFNYFVYIEHPDTLKMLARVEPTIAKGSQTDFKTNGEYQKAKDKYLELKPPTKWQDRQHLSPVEIKERTEESKIYKNRKDAMFAKEKGLFDRYSIGIQANAEKEQQAVSSKPISLAEKQTTIEEGR